MSSPPDEMLRYRCGHQHHTLCPARPTARSSAASVHSARRRSCCEWRGCRGGRGPGLAPGRPATARTRWQPRPHPRLLTPAGQLVPGVEGAGVIGAEVMGGGVPQVPEVEAGGTVLAAAAQAGAKAIYDMVCVRLVQDVLGVMGEGGGVGVYFPSGGRSPRRLPKLVFESGPSGLGVTVDEHEPATSAAPSGRRVGEFPAGFDSGAPHAGEPGAQVRGVRGSTPVFLLKLLHLRLAHHQP